MTAAPITPETFTSLMRQLVADAPDDREVMGGGVGIMFATLNSLGYGEGLAIWFVGSEPKK